MKINNITPAGEKIAVLDIGSSKVVCLIASIKNGNIKVVASGCNSANGFKNGSITDSKAAKLSIIAAIDQAEKASGMTIDSVILSLNGNKIQSYYLTPTIVLRKNKVFDKDVINLVVQGVKELEKQNFEVIHYFPIEYTIDGNSGIQNPSGLLGNKLSAKIHYITINTGMLENIINCLASCQLNVEDCVFSPYAAGLATLSEHDRELGATVIDFGAGITSYAIFSHQKMLHCGYIPIGSKAITDDIAKSFMIDLQSAERIKTINGAANVSYTDNHAMIKYKPEHSANFDNEERNISNLELNEIINARIDEVLNLVKSSLNKQISLCPSAYNRIILTGGGSLLTGIIEEASKIFSTNVRLGKPVNIEGLEQSAINTTFAASIGVLKYLLKQHESNEELASQTPFLNKIITWIKDNF